MVTKYPKCVERVSINPKKKAISLTNSKNIELRYSLKIYLKNKNGSKEVMVIMMNPSKADKYKSDATVNKVIEFIDNKYPNFKCISILNLLPIYCTRSKNLKSEIDSIINISKTKELDKIFDKNIKEIKSVSEKSSMIIMAWGMPKNFPLHLYYDLVHSTINVLRSFSNLYVFKMECKSHKLLTLEKNPRHPVRSNIIDVAKVSVSKRYGILP